MPITANSKTVITDGRDLVTDYLYYSSLVTSGSIGGQSRYQMGNTTVVTSSVGSANGPNGEFANVYYTFRGTQGQGSNYGYRAGGYLWTPPAVPEVDSNTIDRYPFAARVANAADVGDLPEQMTTARGGASSDTNGYVLQGRTPSNVNYISKFPFAAAITNATDVGDLPGIQGFMAGNSSNTHGYSTGGQLQPVPIAPAVPYANRVSRFPFASDGTATDIGSLTNNVLTHSSQTSDTHGYASGGLIIVPTNTQTNVIQRFPFATATITTSDVGDLTVTRDSLTGQSSDTHGYASGGRVPFSPPATAPPQNVIDRFPFAATTTNATDVGDMTTAKKLASGQSSFEHGYISGGNNQPGAGLSPPADPDDSNYFNTVERFPFAATTTNADDVGDLTEKAAGSASNLQY